MRRLKRKLLAYLTIAILLISYSSPIFALPNEVAQGNSNIQIEQTQGEEETEKEQEPEIKEKPQNNGKGAENGNGQNQKIESEEEVAAEDETEKENSGKSEGKGNGNNKIESEEPVEEPVQEEAAEEPAQEEVPQEQATEEDPAADEVIEESAEEPAAESEEMPEEEIVAPEPTVEEEEAIIETNEEEAVEELAIEEAAEEPAQEETQAEEPAQEEAQLEEVVEGEETVVEEEVVDEIVPLAADVQPLVKPAADENTGSLYTTTADGVQQNENTKYESKYHVYIAGDNFQDGEYYVQVTAPNNGILGTSLDNTGDTTPLTISGGSFGPENLIELFEGRVYLDSPNNGDEYKAWISQDPDFLDQKTDNFKAFGVFPEIQIVKEADIDEGYLGDIITYTITIENTTDYMKVKEPTPLTDIHVTDDLLGIDVYYDELLPGEVKVIELPIEELQYQIVKEDEDRGYVLNTAEVTAVYADIANVYDSDDETVDVLFNANPQIEIVKTVDPATAQIGQTVEYTMVVTNTGNVVLENVMLTDDTLGMTPVNIGTLQPGESVVHIEYYEIPGSLNVGDFFENTAVATGEYEQIPVYDDDTAIVEIVITPQPAIIIEKTAYTDDSYTVIRTEAMVGETVFYKVMIENTGNVPVSDIVLNDAMLGIVDFPVGTLNPGQMVEYTNADIAELGYLVPGDQPLGDMINTAIASGLYEETPVSDDDTATVLIVITPDASLMVTKEAYTDDSYTVIRTEAMVGETVFYKVMIENTGNVPVNDIVLNDAMLGIVDFPVGTLDPGQMVEYTNADIAELGYLVPGDQPLGDMINTAIASGLYEETPVSDDDTATVLIVITPDASLMVTKEAYTDDSYTVIRTEAMVGETVFYKVMIENTGNVPVNDIVLNDAMLGIVDFPVGTLDPGQMVEYTNADIAELGYLVPGDQPLGDMINTAIASGLYEETPVSDDDTATVLIVITPDASLMVTKEAYTDDSYTVIRTEAMVGETVFYKVMIENTGNVPVNDIVLNDAMLGIVDFPVGTLDPGQMVEYTNADIAELGYLVPGDQPLGDMINTAIASGLYEETPVSDDDTATVLIVITPDASLMVTKEAYTDDSYTVIRTEAMVGETVFYKVMIENTGNVPVNDIVLNDAMLGIVDFPVGTLDPGQMVEYTNADIAELGYLVPGDQPLGDMINTAIASGLYEETPVSDDDTATVLIVITPDASLMVTKEAYTDDSYTVIRTEAMVGETVFYKVMIENTGNVPVNDIVLNDAMLGIVDFPVGTLDPGQMVEYTNADIAELGYLVPGDQPLGDMINTAIASGLYEETPVSDDDTATVLIVITPQPSISIEKTANLASAQVGETLFYKIVITNNGNVPITGIVLNDSMLGIVDFPVGTLAPGEVITYTTVEIPELEYIIPNDTPLGDMINTAITSGSYEEQIIEVQDEAIVQITETPIQAEPQITITKVSDQDSVFKGETVLYTITVENTGNVLLEEVYINDPDLNVVDYFVGTLNPGESKTYTSSEIPELEYTVPSDQSSSEDVINTASAAGTYEEESVEDSDTSIVDVKSNLDPPPEGPDPNPDPDEPPTEDIPDEPTPLAAPDTVPLAPVIIAEPIEELPEEPIPLAPVLPKTSGIPAMAYQGIGAILAALGIFINKKR